MLISNLFGILLITLIFLVIILLIVMVIDTIYEIVRDWFNLQEKQNDGKGISNKTRKRDGFK